MDVVGRFVRKTDFLFPVASALLFTIYVPAAGGGNYPGLCKTCFTATSHVCVCGSGARKCIGDTASPHMLVWECEAHQKEVPVRLADITLLQSIHIYTENIIPPVSQKEAGGAGPVAVLYSVFSLANQQRLCIVVLQNLRALPELPCGRKDST